MGLEGGGSVDGGSIGGVGGRIDWATPEKRVLAGRSSN